MSDYSFSPKADDSEGKALPSGPEAESGPEETGSTLPEQVQAVIRQNWQRFEATRRLLVDVELTMGEAQQRSNEEVKRPKPYNFFVRRDDRPWYRRHQRSGTPRGL